MSMAQETKAEKEAREAAEAAAVQSVDTSVEPGDGGGRVSVPGADGESIVFSRGVDEVAKFTVKDGHVTAKDGQELQMLLDNVAGAKLAG